MRYAACLLSLLVVVGTLFRSARGDEKMSENKSAVHFTNFPDLPTCMTGAVESGDPSTGSSIILTKGTAGCTVPWHWHTLTEQLMFVSGTARVSVKDGPAKLMHAGDFISFPSKAVHQLTCVEACKLFVSSDAAFDIHYVDASGNEISSDEALKSKAKPAKNKM